MSALELSEGVEVGAFDTGTAGRSVLYKFLGHVCCYPTAELYQEWFQEPTPSLILDAVASLPYPADDLAEALSALFVAWRSFDVEALQDRYTSLFDNCSGRATVSLREGGYVALDTKTLWEELVRFYEHFGLDFHLDHTRVWPDHLTSQLDMLHYLTFIETARGDDLYPLLQGEHDFLSRHLANWVGSLYDRLGQVDEAAPYIDLVRYIKMFLEHDLRYLAARIG